VLLFLTPEMELLDARRLKKHEGDPPTEGAGSLQQRVKKLEK